MSSNFSCLSSSEVEVEGKVDSEVEDTFEVSNLGGVITEAWVKHTCELSFNVNININNAYWKIPCDNNILDINMLKISCNNIYCTNVYDSKVLF